ncbi:MAG: nucleotidyltransferase family protein [bacterium]
MLKYNNMGIKEIQNKISPILKQQEVEKLAIFGSFARGDDDNNSDIDFLVKLGENKTLLDLIGLKFKLENILNKKVDILTYNALNSLLKDKILQEQKIIYEKRS